MNGNAIHAAGVTVRYGRRTAVDDVSISIQHGTVYALLGRNGAGKSSLVRSILGQLRPDRGRVELFGDDVWTNRTRLMDRIGVVPEEADAPPEMRVAELGAFNAKLFSRWQQSAFDERIARFEIDPRARFGELSKGQKKQVMLALALAASPDLVVLDDPTLGLDVVARKSLFEEVITDMADRGITVLITTHDLVSIEAIADRIGVLRDGRMVLDEEVETIKARFRRIRFPSQPVVLSRGTLATANVRQWGNGTEAVVTNYDDLAFERFRDEAQLTSVEVSPMSLEEIFIAVSGGENGAQS
jgi:ABC-2 type transport system ATP-binding protein